jgi:ribulose-phosphate 3-epimerase
MNEAGMSVLDTLIEASPTISVGILTADLMNLQSELALLEVSEVQFLHFDVMDGCFCPMMTVGPPFIKGIRSPLYKDVHLMIQEPLEKVDSYVAAGADIVTIHSESSVYVHRVLQHLGSLTNAVDPSRGLVRGVALNPGTALSVLDPLMDEVEMITLLAINPGWGGQSFLPITYSRISQVQRMISESGRRIALCVDGGITKQNIAEVAGSGVDLVVTGSAVYDGKAPLDNANFMLGALLSNQP